MAISFDGNTDVIAFNSVATDVRDNWAMSVWAYKDSQTAKNEYILSNGLASGRGYQLYVSASTLTPSGTLAGVAFVTGTISISATTWFHVAMTRDASTVTLYVNGAVSTTVGNQPIAPDTECSVGGRPDQPTESWTGSIAEAAIWDSYLSAAEVAALADGYVPLAVRPNNLQLYMPLVRNVICLKKGVPTTNTSTGVTAHPRVIYPKRRRLA
jgi:hypothetical protein